MSSGDNEQVDRALQKAWPPGTDFAAGIARPPGGQEQPSRQLVIDGEGQGKVKRKPRKAKPA